MLLCLAGAATGGAQEVVWSLDFDSEFANREGGDELRPDQTFLFARLAPEIGVQLGDKRSGIHTLKGGVSWYQPLNHDAAGAKVTPTLYYQYSHKGFTTSVGMIPRSLMVERAPRYLWSDSLAYRQPNVRGLLVQYRHRRSYAQLLLDWRQQQADDRREAFNVLISGKAYFGDFWMGGHVQYNHLAKSKLPVDGEGVNDDVCVNPMVGYDWRISPKASLKVKAGAIINLQRDRLADESWLTPCGFTADVLGRWKWLEAEQSIYAGKNLFPLWDKYGSMLNLGDTYYCSKFYSRTSLRAHIVQKRFVDLSAALTFHATDKITGFWQQITCRFYIDQNLWKHRRDKKYLRSGRMLQSNF
ncbi:MAG: hypothetical protein Q4B68_11175, partial [Bacteroidales bacterium]|nr:hypothetical protein [Bacteroidales bacterium]